MTMRTAPPFRADHVGSLLRPARLLKARAEHADGRIDDDELRSVEDDAIRDIVRLQEEVGLQSATDGEFRRSSWHMDFIYALGGVRRVQDHLTVQFHSDEGDIEFTPVGGAGRRAHHPARADLRRRVPLPAVDGDAARRRSSRSRRRAWCTTAAAAPPSTRTSTPTSTSSGSDLTVGLRRPGPRARRARLHLPAVRRHEPRLPQRPRAARARRARSAATPSTSTRRTSATSTRRSPAGRRGWR